MGANGHVYGIFSSIPPPQMLEGAVRLEPGICKGTTMENEAVVCGSGPRPWR